MARRVCILEQGELPAVLGAQLRDAHADEADRRAAGPGSGVEQAHELLGKGGVTGKIVLVRSESPPPESARGCSL